VRYQPGDIQRPAFGTNSFPMLWGSPFMGDEYSLPALLCVRAKPSLLISGPILKRLQLPYSQFISMKQVAGCGQSL